MTWLSVGAAVLFLFLSMAMLTMMIATWDRLGEIEDELMEIRNWIKPSGFVSEVLQRREAIDEGP